MARKKRGLGALGVDVLLSTPNAKTVDRDSKESLHHLPIEVIQPSPYQPRQTVEPEALKALADSVRQQGVVQPIVVREVKGDYQLIAGERRWRAAQQAGLQEIPAIIKSVSDQEAAVIALIENLQREDLNPLEEAQAFANLIEKFDLTHQEVGDMVHRSRAAVSNSLRLLALADPVKELLHQEELEMGHARALLGLQEAEQINNARLIVQRQLSVRAAELLIKKVQQKGKKTRRSDPDADIVRLQQQLSDQLGANVTVLHRQSGGGRLQIDYASLDEFEGIVEKLLHQAK